MPAPTPLLSRMRASSKIMFVLIYVVRCMLARGRGVVGAVHDTQQGTALTARTPLLFSSQALLNTLFTTCQSAQVG